jgi:hypothetical protein
MAESRIAGLAALLTGIEAALRGDPERAFLSDHGWVPFGRNCTSGLEGWGKMIDGKAVIVDQPKALELAGWKA